MGARGASLSNTGSVQIQKQGLSQMDMVATAAHELKTPLSLIAGLSSMLKRGEMGAVDQKQARYLEKIEYSSDRLLRLADGLIAMNRFTNDANSMHFEAVEVGSVITQVINELEPLANQHNQDVILKCRRTLPVILANYQSVYQIFFNLIDNALKYSPSGSRVVVSARITGEHLRVQVRDKGIGISSKELSQLFRRYGANPQPSSSLPGSSGLGLYIVKNLVELHKGSISAHPLVRGTCFKVELPTVQQLSLFDSE